MLSKIETDHILSTLAHLAARWRGLSENSRVNPEIVSHYNKLLCFLIDTGWDDGLALEEELPDEFMPKEYLELSKEWS
ncbi:hypothetical protein [Candidatus Parabeggiatoa sp. HSG14]|uniref:hypothetical protein n=1 Tax=Candidatus Parabeggiatoa sp. HSG14 TaxID=3055593 RepID=UPI0025A6CDC0|nr:hypothetical protein [Thiotrichales bacterium HSG14]